MRLTLLHTRYQLLEYARTPVFLVSLALLPTLSLLFFVVPFKDVTSDPVSATSAVAQLTLFSVMSTYLFTFGIGVAGDRGGAWEPYKRTLPVGVGPQLASRVIAGIALTVVGLIPLIVVGALLTTAHASPVRLLLGVLALLAAGLPFLFGGLAIGYSLSHRAASPVAQLVLFPLAFAGGIFLPPKMFPHWVDVASQLMPSRAGRDVVVSTVTAAVVPVRAAVGLALWTLIAVALAVAAFVRDQGQRYR